MQKVYYTYILECRNKSYYVGVTNNIERRFWEHSFGFGTQSYVWKHRPVKLVYSENYSDIRAAINREKQLKGWCRKKKEALIDQNYEELYRLANLNKSLLPPVSLR